MSRLPLALVLLAACSGKGDDTADTQDTADTADSADTQDTADTSGGPTITLTSVGGDTYLSPTITWEVSGFSVVDELGSDPVDGEGHVHVHVDGEYVDATAASSYTFTPEQLPAGDHEISVRLAGNDHEEVGARDELSFHVLVPEVAISAPLDGATLDSRGVQIGFAFSDFLLSPDVGEANVVGLGHYHLLLDGAYYTLGTDPEQAFYTHLSSGAHTLGVELVNNDHSSLTPPVMGTVTVTVPADAPDIRLADAGYGAPHDSASLPVMLSPESFTLDPDLSGMGEVTPGIGHVHVYLDGVYQYATADTLSYIEHVPAGEHVITAVLANRDHTELGARDSLTVTVADDRPDITITSPPEGERVPDTFNLTVAVENFLLSPDVGGANVPDEGHFHVFVDGAYAGYSATPTTTVTGLTPGSHLIEVMLENNDHTDVDPYVLDAITVTVE